MSTGMFTRGHFVTTSFVGYQVSIQNKVSRTGTEGVLDGEVATLDLPGTPMSTTGSDREESMSKGKIR